MLSMVCRVMGVVILAKALDAMGLACARLFTSNAVLLMIGVFCLWIPALATGAEWLGVFSAAWVGTTGVLTCLFLPGALVWYLVDCWVR